MARIRSRIVAPILVLSTVGLARAQDSLEATGFLSLGVGSFSTDNSRFTDTYDSRTALVGGAGLGIPIVRRLHFYGKVTYFAKTSSDDHAKFRQWIVNGGLQYGLPLSGGVILDFQGGATYSSISEEVLSDEPAGPSSSLQGNGILGFFGGIGAELPLSQSRFSLFAEAQYNLTRKDIASLVGTYGGFTALLGIRYHITN